MVKIVGNREEVEEIVNFIENCISKDIEYLAYHGHIASRSDYIQYETEILK